MDYTNESRQLKKRLQQLSINRRLRLLYYMIWVCQPSDIRRVLWTRRPGRIPSCLGDQLEFQKYEQAYAKFTKSFSAQDRNFINRLTTAQNRRYISSDNDANINAGIRILNQRLQKAQEAREQFFRDTEHIDVIPPPATGSADVGSQFSMLGSHDTWKGGALAPVISDRSSSTVSVSLEPLSFKHKFQFGLNVVEKRFALLPNARRSFLGFLASSLASDLLLLISERFNYMHDRLCTFAKLQFAIMALFGIFLGFPYTFPYYMLRYIAFFAFTLYLSSVYTKVNQDLWTVCREVNAITGRFGIYFDATIIRLTVGLRITFYNVQTFISTEDFVIAAGGMQFLKEFERWDALTPTVPINLASASVLPSFAHFQSFSDTYN